MNDEPDHHAARHAEMGPLHEGGNAHGLARPGRADDQARPGDHGRRDRQDRQCGGSRRWRAAQAPRRRGRAGLSGQGAARRHGAARGQRRRDRRLCRGLRGSGAQRRRGGIGTILPEHRDAARPPSLCTASGQRRIRSCWSTASAATSTTGFSTSTPSPMPGRSTRSTCQAMAVRRRRSPIPRSMRWRMRRSSSWTGSSSSASISSAIRWEGRWPPLSRCAAPIWSARSP